MGPMNCLHGYNLVERANGRDFHVHLALVFLGFNKTRKHCTWMEQRRK
ncbi:unnamed protein product [Musa banksii]